MTLYGFTRITHDEYGKFRDLPEWKDEKIDKEYLHFIGKQTTVKDIKREVDNYNKDNLEELPIDSSFASICKSIVSMLEYGMIETERL